ncbi:MAG: hypothetical protein GY940_10260, partial [bacterium]|nr:hypothetical protein [bacterium]
MIKKGTISCWLVETKTLSTLLSMILSGKIAALRKFDLRCAIMLNGVNIAKEKHKTGFCYVLPIKDIPGNLKVRDYIRNVGILEGAADQDARNVLEQPEIKPIAAYSFAKLRRKKMNTEQLKVVLAAMDL